MVVPAAAPVAALLREVPPPDTILAILGGAARIFGDTGRTKKWGKHFEKVNAHVNSRTLGKFQSVMTVDTAT